MSTQTRVSWNMMVWPLLQALRKIRCWLEVQPCGMLQDQRFSVGVASLNSNVVPEIAHELWDNRALVVAQPVGTEHADIPFSGSATLYLITTPKAPQVLRNCRRAT
jgi:hypothetical protein